MTVPTGRWYRCARRDVRESPALHRGCVFCSGDRIDRGFCFAAYFDGRVQQLGENFQADDKTRTGTREIAIGIERADTSVSNGRDILPANREIDGAIFFARLRCGTSARSGDQEVRLRGDDILERHAEGRTAGLAKDVAASNELNHFRNPVARNINWLEPFKEGDRRAIAKWLLLLRGNNFLFERANSFADRLNQLLGGMGAEGLFADQENVAPNVAEIERIEGQDFRVNGINTLPVRAEFAHQAVDLGRCGVFRNARVDDNLF